MVRVGEVFSLTVVDDSAKFQLCVMHSVGADRQLQLVCSDYKSECIVHELSVPFARRQLPLLSYIHTQV